MTPDNQDIDEGNVAIIAHVSIRDPDTGEIILRRRDKPIEKVLKEDGSDNR